MLVELKLEEPIFGEPTNAQLAEAANLDWFADDANLLSLLQQGSIIENTRTRKIIGSLSSFVEFGDELAYASNPGTAAKIFETPMMGQETYRQLAESFHRTTKKHPAEIAVIATPRPSKEKENTSPTPLTLSKLRLGFLATTADDLIRQPGTELPVIPVHMASLALAGPLKRFRMRKQLEPYEIALHVWKSGDTITYAEPQREVARALIVRPELWNNGVSEAAADILTTQRNMKEQEEIMAQGHHSSTEVAHWKAAREDLERSLAFKVLDIVRLRVDAELKIELEDARKYRSSPYGFVTTKRLRFF